MRREFGYRVLALVALGTVLDPALARAQTIDELKRELLEMRKEMRSMHEKLERQDATIKRLEARERPAGKPAVAATKPPTAPTDAGRALDEALARTEPPPGTEAGAPPTVSTAPTALASQTIGAANLRLIDVSFDTLVVAGTSTADDEEIGNLQAGGHDPRRRGFTLQQGELSLAGAVDPYFTGQAHIVFTDEVVELEEAFMTTQSLPYGLQLRGGHFLTEFGRINPTHPHAWQWIDQPVVNSRFMGPDGLRNPGVRLGWLAPLPWFSQVLVGAQNASGETAVSFLGEGGGHAHEHGAEEEEEAAGIGGRPVVERDVHSLGDLLYLARWENGFAIGDTISAKVGGSALFGPNSTGRNGHTEIYGGDLVVKWRPSDNFRGWPFLAWETEVMGRDYTAQGARDENGILTLPGTTLNDWGLYTQLLYGFTYGWAAGVRYEHATGSGASVGGRDMDPLRDDRDRFSPLLSWRPSEFSRIRLQYNYDRADHLGDDAHSVWLGFEILYGKHPAHAF
jgi:hypothetical protein